MGSAPWWLAWAVYAPMGLVGALWAYGSHRSVLSAPGEPWLFASRTWASLLGLVLAAVLAVATIALTRVLVTRTRWARTLHMSLRSALDGITPARIVQLSLLSAVSEELLFRAALEPSLGLVPSALLFGLLHVSPRGTYFAWTLWAFAMGLVFGVLYEASGTLLAPVLAHALINYENMQYISNFDPTPLDIDRAGGRMSR